ncbi:flagellar type III secretion system pore protein FliP [Geosporobacter ferrireducens]|uniref:Flagellar biosynthetic protein FliP n=2 Tax=Geosporobacter ferrireducens TaxID=1424294 RepID=A0A1D8GBH4_9FIRM|nr:flagellar type III secretion system pore protein FliP [Geosporobacter ferrireducens]AOT68267.1 flagellar biosynthetic protein FliP [Geosporobacter ferrireducens]MTI57311.1 flagellar type III secretion system pore protein FliP [Geosporobacter ferrireducens]
MRIQKRRLGLTIIGILLLVFAISITTSYAEPRMPIPRIGLNMEEAQSPQEVASSIEILFILTILALAPSILMMMTCFTRIIIVLSFIRKAISTQTTPPNQVLIGLALFLTFFIMAPIGAEINSTAVQPYLQEEISQEAALENAMKPVRSFMFRQTREKDLALFIDISGSEKPKQLEDIPSKALIPAFIISELKTGFQIGFVLFIPFIVIDMVVASTLMSMGMMMLPPVMISLPFKILLFIMVDGWNLIIKSLIEGFR